MIRIVPWNSQMSLIVICYALFLVVVKIHNTFLLFPSYLPSFETKIIRNEVSFSNLKGSCYVNKNDTHAIKHVKLDI